MPVRRSRRLAAKRNAAAAADKVITLKAFEAVLGALVLLILAWLQVWFLVREGTECGSIPRAYFAALTGTVFAIELFLLMTACAV